jgi:hypothetical protein
MPGIDCWPAGARRGAGVLEACPQAMLQMLPIRMDEDRDSITHKEVPHTSCDTNPAAERDVSARDSLVTSDYRGNG